MRRPSPDSHSFDIHIEAARQYIIGFPIIINITYKNTTTNAFRLLPALDLYEMDYHPGWRLASLSGDAAIDIEPNPPNNAYPDKVSIKPKSSYRGLIDLSNFGIPINPGFYEFSVRVWDVYSAPVTVEFKNPSDFDAKEAARLRAIALDGDIDYGHWLYLLRNGPHHYHVSPKLSLVAKRQLGLHLFWYQALWGPRSIAQLPTAELDAITEPSLQAEIAALKLEIAVARHDPNAAKMREALLERWPGLTLRVEAIDRGEGPLTAERKENMDILEHRRERQ